MENIVAPFTCKFCGAASWRDPGDQSPPPDYCHPEDHGSPPEPARAAKEPCPDCQDGMVGLSRCPRCTGAGNFPFGLGLRGAPVTPKPTTIPELDILRTVPSTAARNRGDMESHTSRWRKNWLDDLLSISTRTEVANRIQITPGTASDAELLKRHVAADWLRPAWRPAYPRDFLGAFTDAAHAAEKAKIALGLLGSFTDPAEPEPEPERVAKPMDTEQYRMGFARHAALMSKDSKKVGAALVGPDGELRLTGYNGPPQGVDDLRERFDKSKKHLFISHAEQNVIDFAARHGIRTEGCSLYVTHPPCAACARSIIQAGIACVVIDDGELRSDRWGDSLEAAQAMLGEAIVDVDFLTREGADA